MNTRYLFLVILLFSVTFSNAQIFERDPDFTVGSTSFFIKEMLAHNKIYDWCYELRLMNGRLVRPVGTVGMTPPSVITLDKDWVYFYSEEVDYQFNSYIVEKILLNDTIVHE